MEKDYFRVIEMKISMVTLVNRPDIYQENVLMSTLEDKNKIEYVRIENADSAASGLNKGLEKATNDLVICCHQDIWFKEGWFQKLEIVLKKLSNFGFGSGLNDSDDDSDGLINIWGVLGMAGTTFDNIMVGTHSGLGMIDKKDIIRVQTLDGSCLILKKSVCKEYELKFDENLAWFHFYCVDIALQANDKRLGAYVISVPIDHRTKWTSGEGFQESSQYISKKWAKKFGKICTTVGTYY